MVVAGRGKRRGWGPLGSEGEKYLVTCKEKKKKKNSPPESSQFLLVLQFPADCLFDLMFALLTIDGVLVVARGVQKKEKEVNQQFKGGGKVQRMV